MNLTDGRTISRSAVTGSMTGSYFKSPFLYPIVIGCRFDANNTGAVAGVYTITGQDSWGDGWNGATLKWTIDGVSTSWSVSEQTEQLRLQFQRALQLSDSSLRQETGIVRLLIKLIG